MYCIFSLSDPSVIFHGTTQYNILFSLLSSKLLKKETHEDLSTIFSVRLKLFHDDFRPYAGGKCVHSSYSTDTCQRSEVLYSIHFCWRQGVVS